MNEIITGAVFDSGFAITNSAKETREIINATENVKMLKFLDAHTAYVTLLKEYEYNGVLKHQLLPAPRFDEFVKSGFYSIENPEVIANRNKSKARYFTLWNLETFGIFTDVDLLISHFYELCTDFILQEVNSVDDAVNDVFSKYGKCVFPVYPYSGGTEIPMIGNTFKLNCLIYTDFAEYVATHCNVPAELCALNPFYGADSFGIGSFVETSNIAANDTEHDREQELLQIAEILY